MTDRDEARTTASFLRGLTLGAIIGAIVAGSSLWSRRRRARRGDRPVTPG
jgi:hypothetical protein